MGEFSMNADNWRKLDDDERYLTEWLIRFNQAKDIAPHVYRVLQNVKWQKDALKNQPDEAAEIPTGDLSASIDAAHIHLMNTFPLMPEYSRVSANTTGAYSASAGSGIYNFVARVGDLGTPAAKAYSEKFTGLYRNLQVAQDRPQEVRRLVERLRQSQTLARFDTAYKSYLEIKAGGSRAGAAGNVRTLLDGIKGDLFEKARKSPKENMTWETMAGRLVAGASADEDRKQLVLKLINHQSLVNRLSEVLKDREAGSLTNLDDLWTQVLDHIFTVLTLVNLDGA